jgi:NAD(P)-dependent dehydrogenase (short-subunit alcohol dehydrogenase family)
VVLDLDVSTVSGVKAFEVDVADRSAVEQTVREAADSVGGLDAVVTAAGIDRCGKLADVPAEEWEKVIGVNLLGTVSVVRAALPYLKTSKGRVVTVASTLGKRAVADATAYCASKFGVIGFTHALAAETGGEIGVTAMIPGGMNTNFFNDRTEQYKPQNDSRLNSPGNVAQAILFVLSQPPGCEVREMLICHAEEGSWP